VQREQGCYDILTFKGAWEINPATGRNGGAGKHQIIYKYEKFYLKLNMPISKFRQLLLARKQG